METIKTIEPSKLRKYFVEYTVLALAASTVYLFVQLNTLQSYIRNDLASQRQETTKALYQNSILLQVLIDKK